jgi:hypothetical protein
LGGLLRLEVDCTSLVWTQVRFGMDEKQDGTNLQSGKRACRKSEALLQMDSNPSYQELSIPFDDYATISGTKSIARNTQMALIRLRQANEAGEEIGVLLINPDQIVSIIVFNNVTEIHTVDGKAQWVKETPDEVASKTQNAH